MWTVSPEWSEASIAKLGYLPPSLLSFVQSSLHWVGRPIWAAALSDAAVKTQVRIVFNDSLGWLSRRSAGDAEIWVYKNTIRVKPGVWNHVNGPLDLSGPFGMGQLAHELVHVLQYLRFGLVSTAFNLWLPWITGRQHKDIAWECEAADIQKELMALWSIAK